MPKIPQKIEDRRQEVSNLAMVGCTDQEIGHIVDLPPEEVRQYYQKELDLGLSKLKRSLRQAQIKSAIHDRNPAMLKWLGRIILEQEEPVIELKHTGESQVTYEIVDYSMS